MSANCPLHWLVLHGMYRHTGRELVSVEVPREAGFKQDLCADIDGFSLRAAVRCAADDRQALEQLCRYIVGPAIHLHPA